MSASAPVDESTLPEPTAMRPGSWRAQLGDPPRRPLVQGLVGAERPLSITVFEIEADAGKGTLNFHLAKQ